MVRLLNEPENGGRVETGAVRFGDDWNGLFIRGDSAFYLSSSIKTVLGALKAEQPTKGIDLLTAVDNLSSIANLIDKDVVETAVPES